MQERIIYHIAHGLSHTPLNVFTLSLILNYSRFKGCVCVLCCLYLIVFDALSFLKRTHFPKNKNDEFRLLHNHTA